MKSFVIIPARYQSTRFPGKPLAKLLGTESILHTYRAAKTIQGMDGVYIATDDTRIQKLAEADGAAVIMTSESCRNGTERVAEAAQKIGAKKEDLIVNLQGDAPLTPAWFVNALIEKLKSTPEADLVTPVLKCDAADYARLKNDRAHGRVGGVSVVFGHGGQALYFSKEVIPYLPEGKAYGDVPVYHHVGVYGYRMDVLQAYPAWHIGPLETTEQLEQLRFLENGRSVYVTEVDARGVQFWELNNPDDVPIIEKMMQENARLPSVVNLK